MDSLSQSCMSNLRVTSVVLRHGPTWALPRDPKCTGAQPARGNLCIWRPRALLCSRLPDAVKKALSVGLCVEEDVLPHRHNLRNYFHDQTKVPSTVLGFSEVYPGSVRVIGELGSRLGRKKFRGAATVSIS